MPLKQTTERAATELDAMLAELAQLAHPPTGPSRFRTLARIAEDSGMAEKKVSRLLRLADSEGRLERGLVRGTSISGHNTTAMGFAIKPAKKGKP